MQYIYGFRIIVYIIFRIEKGNKVLFLNFTLHLFCYCVHSSSNTVNIHYLVISWHVSNHDEACHNIWYIIISWHVSNHDKACHNMWYMYIIISWYASYHDKACHNMWYIIISWHVSNHDKACYYITTALYHK